MRAYLTLFMISLLLVCGCKKDSPEPVPAIKSLVGKWRIVGYEKIINGQSTWEAATSSNPDYFIFRYDGVLLTAEGRARCCPPQGYFLNGVPFTIEPKEEIKENPICKLVDCVGCAMLNIQQTDDELLISFCSDTKIKLTRI